MENEQENKLRNIRKAVNQKRLNKIILKELHILSYSIIYADLRENTHREDNYVGRRGV